MKKRILSLCVIVAIISSCFNFAFAEPEVVSVGKPIWSVYYDIGGNEYYNENNPPSNANDGNTGTIFYSYAGAGNKDALIIDLLGDFKITSADALFTGGTPEYTMFVSNSIDFAEAYELVNEGGSYVLPDEAKDMTFRYAKLDVSENTQRFRVKEFSVYGTGESSETPDEPDLPEEPDSVKTLPAYEEAKVPVSLNKKAVAKMYNEGGYYSSYAQMTHSTNLAVDGIVGSDNDNAFISAYSDEDWLRIDLGKPTKISDLDIVGYFQNNGVKYDVSLPEWYQVTASNDVCAYNEAFTNYVVMEGSFSGIDGTFTLPEEYKDEKFRFFQITKFKHTGVLDAMIVKEFTVNTYEKDMATVTSYGKPVIVDGVSSYNNALTDGNTSSSVSYQNAVIDMLTPTYIKDITASGTNTDGVTYYGGLENADISKMKLISENPNEPYRYIYVDNSVGASISEIEISTYFSDVLSPWSYDREKESYLVKIKNSDARAERNYTAIVSQLDSEGKTLSTDSKKVIIPSGGEEEITLSPAYAFGVNRVICNIFRDDIVAITNPAVFKNGSLVTDVVASDGEILGSKAFVSSIEKEDINNGLKVKTKVTDGIEETDIYSIIVYSPAGEIVGYMSDMASNEDKTYEFVASMSQPEGKYTVTVCLTDANLKTYYKNYNFRNVLPTADETAECLAEFLATDGSNFQELYSRFYTEKRVIDMGELSFIDNPNVAGRIGYVYAWARDNITKWSNKASAETMDDIFSCLKVALILDSAMNQDINLLDAVKLYGDELSKILIENIGDIAQLYTRKYSDTSCGQVIDNLITCNALASIKGKSVTHIVKMLDTYSTEFKVDTAKLKADGVDLYEIAKRIDNTIPDSYYDGLEAEVNTIVANLPGKKPTTSGGGGGGGGGGGSPSKPSHSTTTDGSSSAITFPAETITGNKLEQNKVPEIKVSFSDVPDIHWAKANIENLAKKGILNGTGEGTFEPERQITRAEFVKIVVSAFGITGTPDSRLAFNDCKVEDWFYPYVDAGIANKLVSGVTHEEFCPNNSIMRQDAAVILDNLLLHLKHKMTMGAEVSFSDAMDISPYAKDAVRILVGAKVISGMEDGSFNPKGALTRAQAATLIVNTLNLIGGEVN